MNLPERFQEKMQHMLGEEYAAYCESYKKDTVTALRVNTLKVSPEDFLQISPFALQSVPWTEKGFYYDAEVDRPAKHPYYYAGLYYIQEPSAMIPASLLPIEKGDAVLDLCAAPGGKATELAAKLQGTGVLVANDISVSRAMALAKNVQMSGARNVVVTAETPENLAHYFSSFFNKIIVDAPCSGEGMFRRDAAMLKDWVERGPSYYAPLQKNILARAYEMLRPGGSMVYSTCTFDVSEDEGMIQSFLEEHQDMHICEVKRFAEFADGRVDLVPNGSVDLKNCVRIFPHRCKGEGHFAVLLAKEGTKEAVEAKRTDTALLNMSMSSLQKKKKGKSKGKASVRGEQRRTDKKAKSNTDSKLWEEWIPQLAEAFSGVLLEKKEKVYLVSKRLPSLQGLRCIQEGLFLGEKKNNGFEPSTQLALALQKEQYPYVLDLPLEDERVIRYLKGETIFTDTNDKGFILICVDGFPLGFGKANGNGMTKNKYYAGWRMM